MTTYELKLEKAERYFQSALLLSEHGDLDSAASRLYYAMFYLAEALLEAKGYAFSSHRSVISAFGQHVTKTNELDTRFHQSLIVAFSQRQIADYRFDNTLSEEDVNLLIVDAKDFLEAARKWFDFNSPE